VIEAALSVESGESRSAGGVTLFGPSRGAVALERGRLTAEGTYEDVRQSFTGGPLGAAPVDVALEQLRFDLAAPLAAGAAPAPYALTLAAQNATGGESFWRALDPDGALPRTPFAMEVDIGGAVRLAEGGVTAGDIDLATLDIRTLRASGAGAALDMSGSVAFDGPGGAPQGVVDVSLRSWAPLVGALVRLGVVGQDQAALAALMLETYNAETAPDGDFIAELRFDGPLVLVNGQPLR